MEKTSFKRIDMNEVVGKMDILFVCIDALRYDVAVKEEADGGTSNINKYGKWEKRHAPGNFTYPSHHAMFTGFFPTPADSKDLDKREILFFPKDVGLGRVAPEGAFSFEGATFIKGLEKVGYETICIGGVSFFDKRSDIGKVFPEMFSQSYWRPNFGCSVKDSFDNQIECIEKVLADIEEKRVFMYVNIDAVHYPNYFYLEQGKKDSIESHAAALKYVDDRIESLLSVFKKRGSTLVILCSDHGTCYGEDGFSNHRISHEVVYTVPYKEFII